MLKQLNDAMEYVERNLCGEICGTELARIACVSQDSFMRFFSYMTGMTLTEYIRRRRLSLAGMELQRENARVIDAAVKYGYDSPDAFARAFVRQHGVTPQQAQHGAALKLWPPAAFEIVIKGAKEMNGRLIERNETVVFGASAEWDQRIYPTRESLRHSMWDEAGENVPLQICEGGWNRKEDASFDGVWFGLWRGGRYMIAREKAFVRSTALESQRIPAGRYAAFITEPGGMAWEELPRLFELIEAWLPGSGFRRAREDIIEVYHLWSDHDKRRSERYYEVWIPVEKIRTE